MYRKNVEVHTFKRILKKCTYYLFIYLLNDAVGNSDYLTSNDLITE
jgi:hypothetical protein